MSGMDKDELMDLLVQRALGQLEPNAAEQLAAVLAANPALAAEASSLERTAQALAATTMATPPARLRVRVIESVRREARARSGAARASRPPWNWSFAVAATAAAVATIALAILAVDHMSLRRGVELESSAAAMLREPNVVLSFTLEAADGGARASGVVLLDLDAQRASISVRDLPALPPGKSYHLWAQLADKHVPCGRFQPRPDGRILTQFPIPVDSYTSPVERLVMTVEMDIDVPSPLGPVVMMSS